MNATYSALSNEQDLHRAAAAHQLEVLERIEKGQSSTPEHSEGALIFPNITDYLCRD